MTEDHTLISNFLRYNERTDGITFTDSAEEAEVIILFEQFSFKLWGYREALSDCALLRKYAHKTFTVNYDDHGRGFLPGCYTSLTTKNFDPQRHRACSYPKTYNQFAAKSGDQLSETSGAPRLLFSFCGTVASHPVRKAIVRQLSGYEDGKVEYVDQVFHQHTDMQKRSYVDQILNSLFVLCPRGWSPTTYRLFEVMALSRCPVIISDEWVPIDGIDWSECSIRIAESDIPRIPDLLLDRRAEAERLGLKARRVWENFFSDESKNRFYLDAIIDLYQGGRQRSPASLSDLYGRWNSWGFYWSNGWTVPQRARFKLDQTIRRVSGR